MKKQSHHNKKTGNVLLWALLVCLIGVFSFGGWNLWKEYRVYRVGTDTYTAIAASAVKEAPPQPSVTVVEEIQPETQIPMAQPEPPAEVLPQVSFSVDFEALRAVNPHIVGWIRDSSGTIDYPVVRGENNTYYLDHLFDGTRNRNGTIFADVRNSPGFIDRNTFLYGHNMQNGAMFAGLLSYTEQSYYEANPTMELVTPESAYLLEVFSGYLTDGSSDTYQLRFVDDAAYTTYLEEIRQQSDFSCGVSVTAEDRMVTLSTCAYDYTDARYVVHCKLVPAEFPDP